MVTGALLAVAVTVATVAPTVTASVVAVREHGVVAKPRFDWSALPGGLLRQLEDDLAIGGPDVVLALARRFGSVPTEDFVRDAWPALRDRWIARDPVVRRSVVSALRARGVGSKTIQGNSARAEVAYLRSCRSSPSLRAIVLTHLLTLGEQGSQAGTVRTGAPPKASRAGAPPKPSRAGSPPKASPRPRGPDELLAQVKEVVRTALGVDEVPVDGDGDIPIPSQASITYVRVFKDAPVVRVFSPVLWDLGNPPDIEGAVNDINRSTNWVKAVWEHGRVVLFSDVVGDPLAESQLAAAIRSVVHRADEMAPALQQRYGGRTAFGAPVPPRQTPIGGYL